MLQIHGRWKIKVTDKVLMQWFADSWNEEAIIAYVKEFKIAAAPLIGSDWAIISIFEQWELGTPEIEQHVTELCQWFKEQGCIKDCHVYQPSSVKEMQLEKMIPNTGMGYDRCVFDHLNEAMLWLDAEGFTLNQPQFLHEIITSRT
ncbi:hypothetical protein [Colwellia sp. C1TZA3]|uniref:hypothetical protein n=1 Tax=Colwellia sp. C1TZA3 TaxID=2508879 RepID=UPI0011B94E9E|nr:hypothetical protein [Colwellia sp. C1TZA3]TWX69985.1 hypothetical protein ESZ39_10825 [Colwellia sp. C1TZA3]